MTKIPTCALTLVCALSFCAEPYDPAKSTATITGVATFAGEIHQMKVIQLHPPCDEMRKDLPELKHEHIVVNSDHKLANLVVYVSKGHEKYTYENWKPAQSILGDQSCQFVPHVLAVGVNQEIRLQSNAQGVAFNWHAYSSENQETNWPQTTTGIYPKTLKYSKPELGIKMNNDVHPWMRAFICVFDHPFFKVTKVDGTFQIKLPPGDYELSFWHEDKNVQVPSLRSCL